MRFALILLIPMMAGPLLGQQNGIVRPDLTQQQTYSAQRSSSSDPLGANKDFRPLPAGVTQTILDANGPGAVTHIWIALADHESMSLKKVVLRMYWDNEVMPSVEAPIGDFFGLGLGVCVPWHSDVLAVGPNCGLNSFFDMPYASHARITVTNEGKMEAWGLFYDIDYRTYPEALRKGTLYFHAQFHQAQPAQGISSDWTHNQDPKADFRTNLDGSGNYVWLDAKGHGQFIGVTMSVLQNRDGWWGEGDEMFFVDGETRPSIAGTGAEDYFQGAGDFGGEAFSYPLSGAPIVGRELAGSQSSAYRFHLESPIPFSKSIRATIEHGNANVRSDNYYSVAYWYQAEPHEPFPALPEVDDRIPRLQSVRGPGSPVTSGVTPP